VDGLSVLLAKLTELLTELARQGRGMAAVEVARWSTLLGLK
jgi:hypothetical protein